jgi:pimeloyl-ACP methyl ester carboxylesterase
MFRSHRYQFGPFVIEPDERLLKRHGVVVPLRAKAFDTLCAVVENGGHLMTKDQLIQRVWRGTFVEDSSLSQSVMLIRKALGDDDDGARYVETVPGRGYRFAATVTRADDDVAADAAALPIVPTTRYARSGDVNIAYQVIGTGPIDIVFVMGWVSHLDYFWKNPLFARFLQRLAAFSRLIVFDKRGTGLSDRVPLAELPTLEQRMEDVHAVMDAAGSARAALIGVSEGGPMCSLFAATYPERSRALVMIGTYAKRLWDPEYPWAPRPDERQHFLDEIREQWGGPVGIEARAPTLAHDPEFRNWWATYLRMGASPGAAVALTRMNTEVDVREVLSSVRVPTLVLHRTGDMCLRVDEGRYVASRIPGARFMELRGSDHLPFVGDQETMLAAIEQFLLDAPAADDPDRVLATILVAQLGARGADSFDSYRGQLEREIHSFRGRPIPSDTAGVMAAFDGPARSIRCASAVSRWAAQHGLDARIGLHTGECDVRKGRLEGVAVKIAQRVTTHARAGEVLVSGTVKDLVAGSGLEFTDRGVSVLERGLGEWRLFGVKSA